ncbi:MAG: hypothetical protein IPN29_02140 [Saprospiraceae bacterium]|nr:hypothetical protein [Saprospiraceae bacterium]
MEFACNRTAKIYDQLHNTRFTNRYNTPEWLFNYNVATYRNLVDKQIGNWYNEALQREQAGKQYRFETNATHSPAMHQLYHIAHQYVKDFALMKEQIVRHHQLEIIHQLEQSGNLPADNIKALCTISPRQLMQFLNADEWVSSQSIKRLLAH